MVTIDSSPMRCGDRGFQVTAAVWNDPAVDWRQFASVVIRAAWDYHLDEPGMPPGCVDARRKTSTSGIPLRRCSRTSTSDISPTSSDAGVAIVPIEYVERGQRQSLRTLLERRNWTRAVVKPAVSASAYGTWRTSLATAAADQKPLR